MDPQNPNAPATSTDRSSDNPAGISLGGTSSSGSATSDVDKALNAADYRSAQVAADTAVSNAQQRYQDAVSALPADQSKVDTATLQSLLKSVDDARNNLTQAEDASARVYEAVARDSANQAAREPDPARQQLWQAQSQLADAHAQEVRANIQAISARTQDDATRAQAAVQNANTRATQVAQLVPTEVQKNVASANLYDERTALLPALTQSQVDANTARAADYLSTAQKNSTYTGYLQARSDYISGAETNKTNAQTGEIQSQTAINDFKANKVLPAELDNLVVTGDLTAAKAAYYKTLPDLKWGDLQNRENMNDAKIAQIMANIQKRVVLPNADKTSPTLAVFQPNTGTVVGTPNPAYVNAQSQAIQDYQSTVQMIQQQIASGQIDPKSADALMSQTYQALQAKIKGTTPADYEKQQQAVALEQQRNALTQQQNAASTLLSGAQEAAGIGNQLTSGIMSLANNKNFGIGKGGAPNLNGFDPYAAGTNVVNQGILGPALNAARSIMATVKPVDPNNPLTFQDALGKTAIAHALNQGAIDPQTAATMLQTSPALGAVLHGAAAANAGNTNPQQPPMPNPDSNTGPIIPPQDQGIQSFAQGGGSAPPGSPGQALLTAANPQNNLGSNADYSSLGGTF